MTLISVFARYHKTKSDEKIAEDVKPSLPNHEPMSDLESHTLEYVSASVENNETITNLQTNDKRILTFQIMSQLKGGERETILTRLLKDDMFKQCIIIHNFLFHGEINGQMESFKIDHLIISPRSILVIETKHNSHVIITSTKDEWTWSFKEEHQTYFDLSHVKQNEYHIKKLHQLLGFHYLTYSVIAYMGQSCKVNYFGPEIICDKDTLKEKCRARLVMDIYNNEPLLPTSIIVDTLRVVNVGGIDYYEKAHQKVVEIDKIKMKKKEFERNKPQ
ncbi:MAG: nuclease-related domain-containing protein [Turicibacter sp.]